MKIILTAAIAVLIGLGIGYFLFSKESVGEVTADHKHEMTENSNEIWICSMHPQIRANEPGDCPICGMDLIPAEVTQNDNPLVLQMTESSAQLANIQTTIIGVESDGEVENSGNTIRLSGKVQADERLASTQVAHVPGRIEKLYVSFTGEKIRKGQKLANIYAPDLITAQRELLEALKLQEINPNLVEAARNKLRFWKIGKEAIEAIEKKGEIQEIFPLIADESGIVTNRRIAVGDYVQKGESLFDLMNLNRVWVLFDAYEDDLSSIKIGDRIEFTTPALPNQVFKTRVTFIDPFINPNTRVASLRTEVNNAKGLLKPEMFVRGLLHQKINIGKDNPLSIPKTAVLWTGKRSVVYTKVPNTQIPSYEFREIELGKSIGDSYLVISGLENREEVVTNGSFSIDAAAQLNNQASMMNRNITVKGIEKVEKIPDFKDITPKDFQTQLQASTTLYLELKDALVATDIESATEFAQKFLQNLKSIDMKLLTGESHQFWMQQQSAINDHANMIAKADDIEKQRQQFEYLSQALIKIVEAFGINGDTLYVQHCPMASNNEGADWLSTEEKIRNPYFGEKMMKCGWVKKSLGTE